MSFQIRDGRLVVSTSQGTPLYKNKKNTKPIPANYTKISANYKKISHQPSTKSSIHVIYMIYCNNENITDTYIGSTINYDSRVSSHKNSCKKIPK